ncbi:hypothetical protein WA026_023686 [Henosepilachna vigintioctopunctata]|uniref:ISXO2-like transposase domain-containing protein n=1 Tax=Henosepilachna vigintioctopunctata TaxID=420089 RepID=A0AAW1TQ71_9CUCU
MACDGCEYKLFEFARLLDDEGKLKEFLMMHGVLKDERTCPKCNKMCKYYPSKNLFQCTTTMMQVNNHKKRVRVSCGFSMSAYKNTFFEKSKLSVTQICHFVVLWLCSGFRQIDYEDEMGWSSHTVVDWSNFCREVCLSTVIKSSEKLGGVGKIVEIDEAKFGKRKYNRGRIIEGQWIFGGIERQSKKIFLIPVPNRSKETLLEIINEWVLPGTTIMSDCWKAYDCLDDEGFLHQKVNHSKNFIDPDTGAHTQHVERMWRDVRNHVPKYGRREHHFDSYLAEYYFKRRFPRFKQRIHNFFKDIAEVYPPTGDQRENDV